MPPQNTWNIVENDVLTHNPNPLFQCKFIYLLYAQACQLYSWGEQVYKHFFMSTNGTGVDLQTYILIGTNTFPYDEMMQVILCVQGTWHSTQAMNSFT
jgi:hypothetical protein